MFWLRLTRLKIHRFRHVCPGTELTFGPTFNVLLGKNGTGKTTLLELVAAILKDDLSALEGEEGGFHIEYEVTDGFGWTLTAEVHQAAEISESEDRRERPSSRMHPRGSVRLAGEGTDRTWRVEGLRATE